MAVELRVPEVGESITEVEIGDWLKKEGERVSREEAVVMIETDKVTVELPAPVSGTVTKIVVAKGQSATVGQVIGYMEEAQPSGSVRPPAPAAAGAPQIVVPPPAPPPMAPPPQPQATTARAAAPAAPAPVAASTSSDNGERVMPAARRALAEAGLTASQVEATGPGGRMLKEDVARARATETKAPVEAPASGGFREEDVVAMTPMRRRIAERLVQVQSTAAMLTTFNECDMSAVMALRKEYQPAFQERYGIKLGFMSFFVKAAIDALKLVPAVNAEIRGTDIVYKNYYDIGVAVGGGKGLVVPIMKNAELMSFAEVEKKISEYGDRARKNALKLDELQGGTFTISNGGIYGSMMSTPILNPPQSGILGLHAINDRAVVKDGQVVVRPMMYLALTYDHRVVDGREAVTFLKRIKEAIEAPARLLIEV